MRQLLGHEAGLPVIDEPLDIGVLADFDRLADVIARQRPLWPPGTRHGYHGVSLGWYKGELIRRLDPERRTLGRFFAEEIGGTARARHPLRRAGDVPRRRLARIERVSLLKVLPKLRHLPPAMAAAMANPRSLSYRTFANPRLRSPAHLDVSKYRRLEFPAGGAVGNARDIARAYAAFSAPRPELGLTPATLEELTRPPSPPAQGWHDEVLKVDTAFSLGFVRPHGLLRLRLQRARVRSPRGGRLVRVRRPRPRRLLRLRDEPDRLPPQRRPAREGAARRALSLPRPRDRPDA